MKKIVLVLVALFLVTIPPSARADHEETPDGDDRGQGMPLDIKYIDHGHNVLFGTRMLGHTVAFYDDVVTEDLLYHPKERGLILRFSTDADRKAERELRLFDTDDSREAWVFDMRGHFKGFGDWSRGTANTIAFSFQRNALRQRPGLKRYTWWALSEDQGRCSSTTDDEVFEGTCVDRSPRLTHHLE